MKSLSGSKKLLSLLCRLGHCANYSTVEGTETELGLAACRNSPILPETFKRLPNLKTRYATDNYDKFISSENGPVGMHDTNAIIFQDVLPVDSANDDANQLRPLDLKTMEKGQRLKRSFEPNLMIFFLLMIYVFSQKAKNVQNTYVAS